MKNKKAIITARPECRCFSKGKGVMVNKGSHLGDALSPLTSPILPRGDLGVTDKAGVLVDFH